MSSLPRTVSELVNPAAKEEVKRAINSLVKAMDEPQIQAVVSIGASVAGGNPITVTIQVVNRTKVPIKSRFVLAVWISTTKLGNPGGTQTVGAPSVGTILDTKAANQSYEVLTDAEGQAVFTITAATGTRHVMAALVGPTYSAAAVWT